jgi:HEAT repeat protein
MNTKTMSYLFMSLIVANNLLWLAVSWGGAGSTDKPIANPENASAAACISATPKRDNAGFTHREAAIIEIPIPRDEIEIPDSTDIATNIETAAVPLQSPAPGPEASTTDLPREASQNHLYQHQFGRDYYYAASPGERLDTIQSLDTQGNDLSLIEEIVHTEDESALRAAAVAKLAYAQNYAATSLLIESLDDPAAEVRLAALDAVVKNGDRTLIPILREKMETMPDGSDRNAVAGSIRRLEYSVTMQMDDIPAD